MKKFFMGGAALLTLGSVAAAADLGVNPYKAAPPTPYVASPWDGLYVGANVGFGNTNFDSTVTGNYPSNNSASANGILGGFEVGYNKQLGMFVLGLETDFQLSSITTTTNGVTTELPWFGTTRGNFGYLITPALLAYGTGGAAYGRADISVPGATVKVPGVGWAAGAGVKYALGGGWSVGAEYLHIELNGPSAAIGNTSIDTKATT